MGQNWKNLWKLRLHEKLDIIKRKSVYNYTVQWTIIEISLQILS